MLFFYQTKSDLIKRIAIVGPECTGKTSLSKTLAAHYQTLWVPEFARGYLHQLGRAYTQSDLLTIAEGQLSLEDSLAKKASNVLICDTNLLVIKIWSEFNFGNCDPQIVKLLHNRHYDLHLLTQIDIPWEDDPLREHPKEREELFSVYQANLKALNIPYVEISGSMENRTHTAIQAIESNLNPYGQGI
jgi:NadR type nicotinamide-nucleotide adenylyltransferase